MLVSIILSCYNITIFNTFHDNSKPIERLGRKAIGPSPKRDGSQLPKGVILL